MSVALSHQTALNGICPYFTMFPLDFPLEILRTRASRGDWVLDPFCGRGTTNFAARLLGLRSLGVDSNPVAAAITASKLVHTRIAEIIQEAQRILCGRAAKNVPVGEFWTWAYHSTTLEAICRLREAFLLDCKSPALLALRGIVLGALHGPLQITYPGYFSNQSPRTYAPKPAYAIRFWSDRGLHPPAIDVMAAIRRRASRFYSALPAALGQWRLADSRRPESVQPPKPRSRFRWLITSPPYYGMRTYRPDQWLRNWFLGASEVVDYTNRDQVAHSSPREFAMDLSAVWRNAANVCSPNAHMVIRFGGITDRRAKPLEIIKTSLIETGWRIRTITHAGTASEGKRQADAFLRERSKAMTEYDVWAVRQ